MARSGLQITPERILEAATDLFSENAYSAVSVDQIAQKAGLTKMTVYQHFKSKEQVFLECLRGRICKREVMLDAFFAALPPDRNALLALFDWLEDWTKPDKFKGCAFVKAVSELSIVIPQVRQVAFEAKQLMKDRIVGLAKASGRPHPVVLGEQMALLVEGAQSLALVESSNRPVRIARGIATALLG